MYINIYINKQSWQNKFHTRSSLCSSNTSKYESVSCSCNLIRGNVSVISCSVISSSNVALYVNIILVVLSNTVFEDNLRFSII